MVLDEAKMKLSTAAFRDRMMSQSRFNKRSVIAKTLRCPSPSKRSKATRARRVCAKSSEYLLSGSWVGTTTSVVMGGGGDDDDK